MPTPLGHSLAGLAIHLVTREARPRRSAAYALALIVLANLPDIDFLPGYIFGAPRAYHWGATHSITALLATSLAAGFVASRLGTRFAHGFALALLAYGSHIVMDMMLGLHHLDSVGLQVFWPFSVERYTLPWGVFLAAPRIPGRGPLSLLFSSDALPLFVRELLVMGPVCIAAWLMGGARVARGDSETCVARTGS